MLSQHYPVLRVMPKPSPEEIDKPMNSLNSLNIEKATQKTVTLLANMMLHLQRTYRFSSMDYPPKASTEHLVVRARQNLAGMLIAEARG